jgi:ribosomal protein S18 acetylase RimI-like enzyme
MIRYRLAGPDDNQQLIELTASSGMTGEISLRIDRKPDFFKLLSLRGETKVFVALDDEKIIGSLCVSAQQVWVGGKILPIQYIGDFKVSEFYRNQGIGLQLCNEMADYVVSTGADLAFLNVSRGNKRPLSFFKNRADIPDFENIGIFTIYQFLGKKETPVSRKYTIEKSSANDRLIQFLNGHYGNYELGPVITKEKLENTEIYTIGNGKELIGAICITDTMNMKQNVVTKLSWKMKWLLQMLHRINGIFGFSGMPKVNETVSMLYIKYLAVNNHNRHLVCELINQARYIAYSKSYSFVSYGIHEKDPLNRCFAGLFKIKFNSVGMLLSIKNNRHLIEKVKNGIPFEDYSMV